ncbi:MAG: GNAT family N-acetyltransferase [Elusimicrobiales bacterium]
MKTEFEFKTLSGRVWPDFERLMGEKGGCGGCWCMSWRVPQGGKLWNEMKGENAKKAMKKLAAEGKARGIIAYAGGEPVAWCTFGPRADFPRLERVKAYQSEDADGVWSVPCFYIKPGWRGKNLSFLLLGRAVDEAKRCGAKMIEGYPATLTKLGGKLPAAFVWVGPEVIFQRHGFKEVARRAVSRPLYRKVV